MVGRATGLVRRRLQQRGSPATPATEMQATEPFFSDLQQQGRNPSTTCGCVPNLSLRAVRHQGGQRVSNSSVAALVMEVNGPVLRWRLVALIGATEPFFPVDVGPSRTQKTQIALLFLLLRSSDDGRIDGDIGQSKFSSFCEKANPWPTSRDLIY